MKVNAGMIVRKRRLLTSFMEDASSNAMMRLAARNRNPDRVTSLVRRDLQPPDRLAAACKASVGSKAGRHGGGNCFRRPRLRVEPELSIIEGLCPDVLHVGRADQVGDHTQPDAIGLQLSD